MSNHHVALSHIREVLAASGPGDAIATARKFLPGFEPGAVMDKPAGKPVVRIATFSKGRTTIAIDYSDGREPDVTKMGSRTEWWAFLAERRP